MLQGRRRDNRGFAMDDDGGTFGGSNERRGAERGKTKRRWTEDGREKNRESESEREEEGEGGSGDKQRVRMIHREHPTNTG